MIENVLELAIIVICSGVLLIASLSRREFMPRFRFIPALTRLYRAVGLSVEDGTRLLVGLGGGSLFTRSSAAVLAGLGLLREVATLAAVSDQPPIAVAGEGSVAFLAQDTLQSGYTSAGAAEYYQPGTGRLTGMTPFSAAVGAIPIITDEGVSATMLVGHFGVEAALLADTAERSNSLLIGASDDPAAQAVLFASATETLIGEELFAGPAYVGGRSVHNASLLLQDILRWFIIALLIAGAVWKIVGLF